MFTMLVLMAVITTAMAGPLLGLLFSSRQLVLERAADNAASAKVSRGAAQLVVLVHDTLSSAKLLNAAVSTLAPNMRAHLDVALFCPPRELHAQTEMGTGLLRSPEEVNARTVLKEQLSAVQRRGMSSSVTVRTTEDPVAEALVHIRARDPQLVVTDWPASEEERTQLKELVVGSPCTVVLWGGYSPTMSHSTGAGSPTPAAAAHKGLPVEAVVPSTSTESNGLASMPSSRIKQQHKPRPTLLELLRNETAQDEFAEDVMNAIWRGLASAQTAIERRLPAFLQPDAAAADAARLAREEDFDDDEHGDTHGAPRVKSDPSVVTPQTMAVAAASSLSPKFSKLMVTGWPDNSEECAELVKFLHDGASPMMTISLLHAHAYARAICAVVSQWSTRSLPSASRLIRAALSVGARTWARSATCCRSSPKIRTMCRSSLATTTAQLAPGSCCGQSPACPATHPRRTWIASPLSARCSARCLVLR